ncbi:tRNA threonylcarbamoyladenosine biosynthesis protein TsaB [Buchnera aphidicola (Eriosoma lanigerum)]|uniref:tRNA (adenosine(37)-N6)-threonylcarbamoyltransferase complex dimerization subunit type 1 TsaB n=1 Tax=Buchnera aphidicola TaxID=9 RepID=UPI003464457D
MNNIILSIDTSLQGCSVALLVGKNIDYILQYCSNDHTKKILPMINEILNRNKLKLKNIDYIAVSNGPGQFTGIRTGICVAQGLSITMNIPIITFSTLEVLAEQAWRITSKKKIIIAIRSNKTEIYWGEYIKNPCGTWKKHSKEIILNNQEICRKISKFKSIWIKVGNGWNYMHNCSCNQIKQYKSISIPHARDIITLSINWIKKNKLNSIKKVLPNYLYNYV